VASAATAALLLDRRALHRAIGAVDAAIARFRAKQGFAVAAFIVELASIGRHGFPPGKSAVRAGDYRFKDGSRHGVFLWGFRAVPLMHYLIEATM
jgi:hypothetical protein